MKGSPSVLVLSVGVNSAAATPDASSSSGQESLQFLAVVGSRVQSELPLVSTSFDGRPCSSVAAADVSQSRLEAGTHLPQASSSTPYGTAALFTPGRWTPAIHVPTRKYLRRGKIV